MGGKHYIVAIYSNSQSQDIFQPIWAFRLVNFHCLTKLILAAVLEMHVWTFSVAYYDDWYNDHLETQDAEIVWVQCNSGCMML